MNSGPSSLERSSAKAGFMLIELLAVFAIIFILFALYWGGGSLRRGNNQFAVCQRNLQGIHVAIMTFATDNNDSFPFDRRAETSDAVLAQLVPKYTSQTASFICPASHDSVLPEAKPFANKRISYAYVMGLSRTNEPTQFILSDEQIDTKPKPAGGRVFSEDGKGPGSNHGANGGNVLFIDGSAQPIPVKTPSALAFENATLLNPKPKH
jgi:prepilin-type processing-associated H-X9-DG protein